VCLGLSINCSRVKMYVSNRSLSPGRFDAEFFISISMSSRSPQRKLSRRITGMINKVTHGIARTTRHHLHRSTSSAIPSPSLCDSETSTLIGDDSDHFNKGSFISLIKKRGTGKKKATRTRTTGSQCSTYHASRTANLHHPLTYVP
jgi:hypothetical protein